jgi:hypothetical protein
MRGVRSTACRARPELRVMHHAVEDSHVLAPRVSAPAVWFPSCRCHHTSCPHVLRICRYRLSVPISVWVPSVLLHRVRPPCCARFYRRRYASYALLVARGSCGHAFPRVEHPRSWRTIRPIRGSTTNSTMLPVLPSRWNPEGPATPQSRCVETPRDSASESSCSPRTPLATLQRNEAHPGGGFSSCVLAHVRRRDTESFP